MKYLYGDLSEFPAGENTLDLLRRMIDMSVDVLLLDKKIGDCLAAIESDRQFLAASLAGVDDFHQQLHCFIAEKISRLEKDDPVAVMAEGVAERIKLFVEDGKARLVRRVEERIQASQQEIVGLGGRMFERLGHFYSPNPLPVRSNRLRCVFDGSRYQATTEITDVTGVCCKYSVDAAAVELFSAPRKGLDLFAGRFDMPVGRKKGWLKKEPAPELYRFDEALLTDLADDEGNCQIRFTKKTASGSEGVSFIVSGGGQIVSALRFDSSGQEHPIEQDLIGPEHQERIRALCERLRPAMVALYRTAGAVSSLTIDGQDIVGSRLASELARRLVSFLAPTVREIAARSNSPAELCLKIEHSEGRREEIYVPKKDLLSRLAQLAPAHRAIFTPLGLDVPGREVFAEVVDDGPTHPS